ncbi:MAG: glucosaminidase domain-containing protein [Muribaculaceae bacterium]|nr:glucosaminidase domain-containing protein [Muribaculaceae bacterium]
MKIYLRLLLIAVSCVAMASCSTYRETHSDKYSICGPQEVDTEAMYRFVKSRNPKFDRRIAKAFSEVGRRYGIRGDVALCQAILETGWFKFDNGTAVKPSQHNYCGMGVKKRGERGASFASIEEGVTAMMQHLYAYSSTQPLPRGEKLMDPRFKLVKRGSAPTWHSLSGRWAANPSYGSGILDLYSKMKKFKQ